MRDRYQIKDLLEKENRPKSSQLHCYRYSQVSQGQRTDSAGDCLLDAGCTGCPAREDADFRVGARATFRLEAFLSTYNLIFCFTRYTHMLNSANYESHCEYNSAKYNSSDRAPPETY